MKNILVFGLSFILCLVGYSQTYVPDDNFEQALIDLGYDSPPLDDFVPTANIDGLVTLNINGEGISDLTGIEDFSFLQILIAPSNNLSNVDISQNTNLREVNFNSNNLTSIDVTNNILLEKLSCSNNNLTSLIVSQNLMLEYLHCSDNFLNNIEVTNNPFLNTLFIDNNNLSVINVTQNPLLEALTISNNNISDINVTQNPALKGLSINSNQISEIDITQNNNLEGLSCGFNNLTELNVTQNPLLNIIRCFSNQITSLDVSQNNLLIDFNFANNLIETIDLSNNLLLQFLGTSSNQIIELDVSQNPELIGVSASVNPIEVLNVKNGNNTNFVFFNAFDCPNLFCIEVDDPIYSVNNWPNVDPQVEFSEDCDPLGINDFNIIETKAYPNPVEKYFILEAKLFSEIDNLQIKFYNVQGKLIHELNKVAAENQQLKILIDISSYSTGTYFYSVYSRGKQLFNGKIIKNR